jgi:hypothetical protein
VRFLMFAPRFHAPVRSGAKSQTIREERERDPVAPGEELSLRRWVGKPYRSRHEELVPGGVVCRAVRPVKVVTDPAARSVRVWLDYSPLLREDLRQFIAADGFESAEDMFNYYLSAGVKLREGVVIAW